MDLNLHCQLCDHKTNNILLNSICGITHDEPKFSNKCTNIKLEENLEKQIKKINLEYELLFNSIYSSVAKSFAFFLLSLKLIYLGLLSNTLFVLILMAIVALILIIFSSLKPLIIFLISLFKAKKKKKTLDDLLVNYGINYLCDIEIKKDVHGNIATSVNLNFINKDSVVQVVADDIFVNKMR